MQLLTNSRIQAFKTCPRLHYIEYELGYRKEKGSAPLRIGTAVHLGLDLIAQKISHDDAVMKIHESYSVVPEWCTSQGLENERMVECEIAVRLVLGYAWYWQNSDITVMHTEQRFEIPICNPDTGAQSTTWKCAGKIDKIVKRGNSLAIMEHKTTGDPINSGSDYWTRLRMDQQVTLYLHAAREMGYAIDHIYWDAIHKPGIRPKNPIAGLKVGEQKALAETSLYFNETFLLSEVEAAIKNKKESPRMFGARLSASIAAEPEKYFARQEVPRLGSDLQRFRQGLWQTQKTIRFCQNNGYWDIHDRSCLHPYKCDHFDLCTTGICLEDGVPAGYVQLDNVHPELETTNAPESTAATTTTAAE